MYIFESTVFFECSNKLCMFQILSACEVINVHARKPPETFSVLQNNIMSTPDMIDLCHMTAR